MLYDIKPDERLFTGHKILPQSRNGEGRSRRALRKSVSTIFAIVRFHSLINMGFSVLAIGERMGHEAEKITYRYAHLFPTVQTEMAEKLEMERMTKED